MAKYLKENQIKAGVTIYVTHPKFKYIECKFVTTKPFIDNTTNWEFKKFKYKSVQNFLIDSSGHVAPTQKLFKIEGEWGEIYSFCGDEGIPDKDGVFSYKQERRAFPTLKKAVEYWTSQQTPENFKRWEEDTINDSAWDW